MSEPDDTISPEEAVMLATLADMGQLDAPPGELLDAGRAIWAWRTIDAELAELAYDSDDDVDALVGVRGSGGLRQLAFESGRLSLRVEVSPGPPVRLMGQLTPSAAAVVEVRTLEGTTTVEADEHGRFQVVGVGPGPISLRCAAKEAPDHPVATAWVVV